VPILAGLGEAHGDLFNRKSLRNVLKNWDLSKQLGEHPLARLQIVEQRRLEAGYSENPMGYGIALRDVLKEVINELRPDMEEPGYLEKRWRSFLILSEQYLHGRSPDFVCEQLGIARSTYNHEQAQAFEKLIDILRQKEFLQTTFEVTIEEEGREKARGKKAPFLAPPKPDYTLIGREDLLLDLKEQFIKADGLNLAAIYGLPGIGKTTLAIELANDPHMREHFEDGVLWAGLGRRPDIMAVLSLWGGALGVPMDEIAKWLLLEDRARAIHAAIGTRRMLLVIDDVWEASEGMAFKIGGPNCAYLVTTRLPKVAIEFAGRGARALQELDLEDGLRLLSRFTPEVVGGAPQEARALVQEVGCLPLAIVLMGRYLQIEAHAGQTQRLRRAIERLQGKEARMQLTQPISPLDHQPSLPANTPLSLHTVIAISDESLDKASQKALRALSVFPPKPNTFSEEAAFYVSQASVETLDHLVDCGLIESRPPDRYTLHQTIAEYAGMARDDEGPWRRFVAFYMQQVVDHTLDFEVLDPETRNIFTALRASEDLKMKPELIRCAINIFPFIESKGLFEQVEGHLEEAVQAARQLKDEIGLLALLLHLGSVSHRCGNYEQAEKHYQEGKDLSQKLGDESRQCEIFKGLGIVAYSRGRYQEAEKWYGQGLRLARSIRDTALEGAILTNLGVLLNSLGKVIEAEDHFQEALRSARAVGNRETVSRLLMNLGVMAGRQWDYSRAEAFFQESLELARSAGRQDTMSFILTNLGTLANDQGDYSLAEKYFQEGLSLAREMNDRARISHLLANLGALANARQNYSQAYTFLEEGLALARKIGHRENTSLLLTNLAVLMKDQGDLEGSEDHFQEALFLAEEMGHRRYIAAILCNWAELYLIQQRWEEARGAFQQARQIANEIDLQELGASSLFGLARLAASVDDKQEAKHRAKESLQAFQKIKHRKADEVKAWLRNLR
jgi:tetratricopeptide (TPR) repeat protein